MVGGKKTVGQGQEEEMIREILRALRDIRFGSIHLVVQDGKVIQIDTTEKVRLPRETAG